MERLLSENNSNAEETYSVTENMQNYRELVRPTNNRHFNVSADDPYVSKFSTFIGNKDAAVIPDNSHPPNFTLLASSTPSRGQQIVNELPRNCEPNLEVELLDRDLWEEFSNVGTEMIVTKAGRRMFPGYRVRIQGLNPNEQYCVFMDVVNVDQHRYKFQGGEWMVAGRGEQHLPRRMFLHPDSPSCGRKWMSDLVSFNKVKLTNSNTAQSTDKITLNSMHRYQPRIHIVKTSDITRLDRELMSTFAFPQTVFITVTAYQNGKVTKLKINNNPFAKGFRDNGARTNFNSSKNTPPTKRQKSNNSSGQNTNSGSNSNHESMLSVLPIVSLNTSDVTNSGESVAALESSQQRDKDFLLHFPRIAKKEPLNTTILNSTEREGVANYMNTSHRQLFALPHHNTTHNGFNQTFHTTKRSFNSSQIHNSLVNCYLPSQSQFMPHLYDPYHTIPSSYIIQNNFPQSKSIANSCQTNTVHSVYNMLHADTTQYKSSTQNIIPANKMYAF